MNFNPSQVAPDLNRKPLDSRSNTDERYQGAAKPSTPHRDDSRLSDRAQCAFHGHQRAIPPQPERLALRTFVDEGKPAHVPAKENAMSTNVSTQLVWRA